MKRVALASLKRKLDTAAEGLRALGDPIYLDSLARTVDMDRSYLFRLMQFVVPEWRAELQIVDGRKDNWNKRLLCDLYDFAAKLLLKQDHLPTAQNLAEMLKIRDNAVRQFMKRHPDIAKKIGFCTRTESEVYHAGRKIRFRGEPVTRVAIGRESGLCRATVWKVLLKRPDFIERLALKKTKRRKKSKVIAYELTATDSARSTRSRRRTLSRSERQLANSIIATVCEQRQVERQKVVKKRLGGLRNAEAARIQEVRKLIVHLLVEDVGLNLVQVAPLLGNRHISCLCRARQSIRQDLKHSDIQDEIVAMRRKFSGR